MTDMSERARALEQAREVKEPCPHCGRTDYRWTHEFRVGLSFSPEDKLEVRCDYCRPLRMDAYYFSFSETGVDAIDRILSAVAQAGKGYHHTELWGDEDLEDMGEFHGGSYVAWIQNAANDAAKRLAVDPPPSGASSVDAPIYRQVYIVTHYPEGGLRGVHASQAGAEAEIAELCREYPDYTRQDFSIVCDRIRPSPPSGASPQAETSAHVHAFVTVELCGECLRTEADITNSCHHCNETTVGRCWWCLRKRPSTPAPVSPVEPEPPTGVR